MAISNKKLVVRMGGEPLFEVEEDGLFAIEAIEIHPNYNLEEGGPVENDIALARLELLGDTKVLNPEDLGPMVCLTSDRFNMTLMKARIAGYGRTRYRGSLSKRLLEAEIIIRPRSSCQQSYPSIFTSKKVFCANGQVLERTEPRFLNVMIQGTERTLEVPDACQGDSGGPLMIRKRSRIFGLGSEEERLFQVGVIAGGRGCGDFKSPGIYVDVREHMSWISRILK